MIRVDVKPGVEEEILALARNGAEIIHLSADAGGRGAKGEPLLPCLRRSHVLLVEEGIRDAVTLIASGGIAAAEHVPKTIVLGADAVVVDVPLVIAMECTVCGQCLELKPCPRRLDDLNPKWGASRVINLMVSWRDQLLEVLGAMGIRDVRRLRGEMGRAMLADEMRADFLKRLASADAPAPAARAAAASPMHSASDDRPAPEPHKSPRSVKRRAGPRSLSDKRRPPQGRHRPRQVHGLRALRLDLPASRPPPDRREGCTSTSRSMTAAWVRLARKTTGAASRSAPGGRSALK